MLASVAVRCIVQVENRRAIDLAVKNSEETSREEVKILVSLPNSKIVTIRTTRGIAIDCLLTTPRVRNPKLYNATRALAWVFFGVHIISLGMACLFSQIIAIVLLISATVIAARQIGMDRGHIGHRMNLERFDDSKHSFRAATYAQLKLSREEEESMVIWSLFPHRSNKKWWKKY